MQGRRGDRLDGDDARRTLDGGGDPGHQAAAADGDQHGVDAVSRARRAAPSARGRGCPRRHRSRAGRRRGSRSHRCPRCAPSRRRRRRRTRCRAPRPGRRTRGAGGAGRRRVGRDEDGGGNPDDRRGEGVRESGVAARRDHDPDVRVELAPLVRRQDAVEGAARLERAGVLQQLELQAAAPGQPVVSGVDDLHRSTTDAAADASCCDLEVLPIHRVIVAPVRDERDPGTRHAAGVSGAPGSRRGGGGGI